MTLALGAVLFTMASFKTILIYLVVKTRKRFSVFSQKNITVYKYKSKIIRLVISTVRNF